MKIIDETETQTKKTKQRKKKQTNKKASKDRKEQGGTEAIVKECGLNNFVVHLS